MPGIFTNNVTGEINSDSPDLQADDQQPTPEPKPAEEKPGGSDTLTSPQPGSPAAARREFARLRQEVIDDIYHPGRNEHDPLHEAAWKDYVRLRMLADGKDADDPEQNPDLLEVFPNGMS